MDDGNDEITLVESLFDEPTVQRSVLISNAIIAFSAADNGILTYLSPKERRYFIEQILSSLRMQLEQIGNIGGEAEAKRKGSNLRYLLIRVLQTLALGSLIIWF